MASPTQWTQVWANSRRWWRTGKPGVWQSMGSQRVGHDVAAKQQLSSEVLSDVLWVQEALACMLSHFSRVQHSATSWTMAHQAPLSIGLSRQECWVASSFPSDKVWSEWSEVTQSCPTLCDPRDCSLLCSSVHGSFQARVLEWVAISFSPGSSQITKNLPWSQPHSHMWQESNVPRRLNKNHGPFFPSEASGPGHRGCPCRWRWAVGQEGMSCRFWSPNSQAGMNSLFEKERGEVSSPTALE